MKDFILSALPFVIIGLCFLALIFANSNKNNYCSEGMCVGMCTGSAISYATKIDFGHGISLGMLIGEAVGSFIKKE